MNKFLEKVGLKIYFDKNRIFGLDIMRAFAISIVLITHSIYFLPASIVHIIYNVSLDGVSIFFVLSGFLIGGILIKTIEKEGNGIRVLINFWLKRWLRTIPNYFLVFSVVYLCYYHASTGSMPTLKSYYIFSQNIYKPQPGYFIEGWSLSVEEWFYLSVPFFIFILLNFCKMSLKKSVLIVCVIIILFSTGFRYYRFLHKDLYSGDIFEMYFRMQVITRLDSIMYGVIGAYFSRYFASYWTSNKIALLTLGILGLIVNKYCQLNFSDTTYYYVFYLATNGLFTLFLLPFFSQYNRNSVFFYRIITYISLVSYSLYLTNLTLVQTFIIPYIDSAKYSCRIKLHLFYSK